jgi:hypothetical protein
MPTLTDFFDRPAFTTAYTRTRGKRSFVDYYKRLLQSFNAIFRQNWSGITCGSNPDTDLFSNAISGAKDTSRALGSAIYQVLCEHQNGHSFRELKKYYLRC